MPEQEHFIAQLGPFSVSVPILNEDHYQTLKDLTPAELLGLIVAHTSHDFAHDCQRAREIAMALEEELARAEAHLTNLVRQLEGRTTFAADTRETDAAREWLNRTP